MTDRLTTLVNGSLETAYLEGLAQGGISPDEMTAEDTVNLARLQAQQQEFIANFAADVQAARSDPAQQSAILDNRLALWAQTVEAARYLGLARAKPDELCIFTGPDGKESCADCQRFKDEPHTRQWFAENNFTPAPGCALACGGWQCEHELQPAGA